MLQKILVILVGLVMSLVGAFAPSSSLFASHPAPDAGLSLASSAAHDETLATVRVADGTAFAKVSVLWVEVDGQRVSEDAWGTGDVKELRFKIGTKDVDGLALAVGDKVIAVHPTDVLTVRTFNGQFAYRGLGTPAATLALQGTVKTALVSQGAATQRVQTEAAAPRVAQPAPADGRLAYVVLDTGEHLDTVDVQSTSQRFYTEETAATSPQPGNLLARYVKIDGRLVKDYTSGDGSLGTIEFQPAAADTAGGLVAVDGQPATVDANAKVLVKDFVGEYLVYQVADGLVRLRLDGYAANYTTGDAASLPASAGADVLNAAFDFEPKSPRTSDTLAFHDRSSAEGYVVFRQWDFGDNQTSVVSDPTHRYALPGVYEVRLNVTDNDLHQREVVIPVIVRNADPVPAFDFAPRVVDTGTLVAFTDRSDDADGAVVNWSWDFGDGAHAFQRNPTHQYQAAGNLTVTLTATDNLGGRQSLSRVIIVRDAPPLANFVFEPTDAQTLTPVQFIDRSTDRDGVVVAWNWSFGDGSYAEGSAPTHTFEKPGAYSVSLTAYDNNGVASTLTQQVIALNRPPVADFAWTPQGGPVNVPVTFTSTSYDPEGLPLITQWDFGDGSSGSLGPTAQHVFPRHGEYNVTVHVTDGLAQTSLTRSVSVADSAPRASLSLTPNPAYRGTVVLFADTSTDLDGDPIVARSWSFGDGQTSTLAFPNHTYSALGDYPITLTVRDGANMSSFVTTTLHVINRPPIGAARFSPALPVARQLITLDATATDPDGPANETFTYAWTFSDGGAPASGPEVTHAFQATGDYTVTLVVTDAEGGVSSPVLTRIHVGLADPLPAFTWNPLIPNAGETVTFTDQSTSPNGAIQSWAWDFGDGSPESGARNPTHAFPSDQVYAVLLTVTDSEGQLATTAQNVTVNGFPVAAFVAPTAPLSAGGVAQFTDESHDPDGDALTYAWDFGDGAHSTAQNPSHPYLSPGAYTARLTVTDPHGAADNATRVVVVQDRAPTAGFSASPNPAMAGQPVSFEGATFSHDPDGDSTLRFFNWTFGDGGGATGHAVSHAYANSGTYPVTLIVSDGSLASAPATSFVRVGSDHQVRVRVQAILPGERQAMLNDSHYLLNVTVRNAGANPVALGKGDLVPDGSGYDVVLNAGTWMAGDSVTVSVFDDRWMHAPVSRNLPLTDADGRAGPVALPIELNVPLKPTVAADAGDGYLQVAGMGVPGLPNETQDGRGDPVYRTATEAFHGAGTVFYADGAPAEGASVVVEARYLPLELVAGVRDGQALTGQPLVPDNVALGWCRADATPVVDAAGAYSWRFQGGGCLLGTAGVFPVGVWEIRATATYSFAASGVSTVQTVIVDPTGGLLWQSTGGTPP